MLETYVGRCLCIQKKRTAERRRGEETHEVYSRKLMRKRSPYTGMTREHWIGISHFFLEGIFEHVEKLEDPIVVLRHETKVSYPQPDGPKWRIAGWNGSRDLPGAF